MDTTNMRTRFHTLVRVLFYKLWLGFGAPVRAAHEECGEAHVHSSEVRQSSVQSSAGRQAIRNKTPWAMLSVYNSPDT